VNSRSVPYQFQQFNQLLQLFLSDVAEHFPAKLFERPIHLAQKLQPGSGDLSVDDAAIELGLALLNRQATTNAIAAFQQAVNLQPRSAAARVYLALGYLRAQRGHEAANELRTAKELDAGQANEFVTKALHMPPSPGNLDMIIAQSTGQ